MRTYQSLTLTLSPFIGERGNPRACLRTFALSSLWNKVPCFLPLPVGRGEGWGEGNFQLHRYVLGAATL